MHVRCCWFGVGAVGDLEMVTTTTATMFEVVQEKKKSKKSLRFQVHRQMVGAKVKSKTNKTRVLIWL